MYIYPNPVHNQLNIIPENIPKGKILQANLYDAVGKRILGTEANLSEIENNINHLLPSLHKGLYLLQIYVDKKVLTIKFIKE
jgi:hypothetical protein